MSEALPGGSSPALHAVARWLASWLFRPCYRIRVYGRERIPASGPVVMVANHSAAVDGPLLLGLPRRPTVFLVKHQMFRGPLGPLLRWIGQLPVRRGQPDRTPLLAAVAVLRVGGLVGVFPEGSRGEGDVAAAQHGAAWFARASGALVLPVAVRGTRRLPGSGRRFRPRVDVLVGEPFDLPAGRGRAGLAEATDRLRKGLVEVVAELDGMRGAVVRR